MRKPLLLVLALLFCLNQASFANEGEETSNETAATEATENTEAAPEPQAAAEPVEKAEVAQTSGVNGGNERDQALAERVRELVKRFDAADRNGKQFPFKHVESAIRAEFMRRTEGGVGISWFGKKTVNEADVNVAQDNLELFLTYVERVMTLNKKAKPSRKEEEEMMLMAVKHVIDDYNSNANKNQARGLASLGTTPTDLTGPGKAELNRRRKLVGGLVAGDDYKPLKVSKVDDIGKAYKAALQGAAREYDAIATAMNKATGGGAKAKTASKGKR